MQLHPSLYAWILDWYCMLRPLKFLAVTVNDRFVSLTPSQPGRHGAIWSTLPNEDMSEWTAVLSLRVSGANTNVGSEGMAFWYTESRAQMGHVFGGNDTWNGLGVFLDSFDNDGKARES